MARRRNEPWPERKRPDRRSPRVTIPALVTLAMASVLPITACDRDDPGPFALAPCSLGEEPATKLDIRHLSRAGDLEPALKDAAERAALALPEGDLRVEIRDAVRDLSTTLGGGDTTCRLYVLSSRALARLDRLDHPGSLPDRIVIRTTLDLTRAALEAR